MEYRKLKYLGILLFFIQILGIGSWFYVVQPEMDLSMDTLKIMPMLFGINLLAGLLLHLLKKKDVAKLMFGNSILCPLIFFAGWILWFTYYAQ
ncbi:MAG: hypothetical protein WBM53_12150 [Maribacter sp.]